MLRLVRFPENPALANEIAAWILIIIGSAGFVGTLFGLQNIMGLPNLYVSMGWSGLTVRLNFLAPAIVVFGFLLASLTPWTRRVAVVGLWIMVAGTAAGAILLVVFASKLPQEIVVVEGCLDVVWLLLVGRSHA